MNNRYFGDINDYRKYGLLRHLCGGGAMTLGVCWMLTNHNPEEGHGGKTDYLKKPGENRGFDGELFDSLRDAVGSRNDRDVARIEESGLLTGAKFFRKTLTADNREEYFDGALDALGGVDLLFFDPDVGTTIGINNPSRRETAKYIHREEIARAYRRGASVLVYQHQRRSWAWSKTIPEIASQLKNIDGNVGGVFSFLPNPRFVAFLLAVQKRHLPHIRKRMDSLCKRWPDGEIQLFSEQE
jgi:hypothetical protein